MTIEERNKLIYDAYLNGAEVAELANRYDMAESSIRCIISEHKHYIPPVDKLWNWLLSSKWTG